MVILDIVPEVTKIVLFDSSLTQLCYRVEISKPLYFLTLKAYFMTKKQLLELLDPFADDAEICADNCNIHSFKIIGVERSRREIEDDKWEYVHTEAICILKLERE